MTAHRLCLVALALLLSAPAPGSRAEPGDKEHAAFAGGCFWSMEQPFDQLRGVLSTTSGFTGGTEVNPTYEQVASGRTGHAEVVLVLFDSRKVSYEKLLEVFWRNVDPLDAGGQFCDRGKQYRTAIFYETEEQRRAAIASKERIEETSRLPGAIVTQIAPLKVFYAADPSHQDYYLTNLRKYWTYRQGCGRDRRLRELWGPPHH